MAKQRSAPARKPRRPRTQTEAVDHALAELEAMTPRQVMQTLVDAGIYTPTFRLTRKYRDAAVRSTPRSRRVPRGNGRSAVER